MSFVVALPQSHHGQVNSRLANKEPVWVRWTLITVALLFLTGFLVMPLVVVFSQAFSKGWSVYVSALVEPNALAAIRLTLLVAAITVPLNLVFGLSAAWAIA